MSDLVLFGNLKIFSNGDFEISYFKRGDDYFFKAIDIAGSLKYKNPDKAVRMHVKDKYKCSFPGDDTPPNWGGINLRGRNAIFITLPGLFQFIAQSNMPAAEPFQNWVFEQVLPSIAKTGEYKLTLEQRVDAVLEGVEVANKPLARKMLLKACDQVKGQDKSNKGRLGGRKCQEKIRATKRENAELKKEVARLEAEKAEYKDRFRQQKLDLDYFRVLSKCLEP